ncbi:reverse transcriptase domain-containing protein [Tanacetum coccineum]
MAMTADENSKSDTEEPPFEKITFNTDYKIKTSLEEAPTDLELKPLPDNLEYAFLEEPSFLRSYHLSSLNKTKTSIIYPIADSPWVSPIHCVPKKGGITVVTNEKEELVATRTVTSWRVCIYYCKLNEATAKDHFALPFMDQMLERLAGNKYFCILDGFFGYFQIPIDPMDQEKTTFTCPFGTYAYRRTPFGLCNAPSTFQRCMLAIFHDMIKESIEVSMDDFFVFGNSFDNCLNNLDKMLQRCKDAHLVLNWEKCHFLVKEGIVLGHKVSKACLEVDKAKIDVISKLTPLTNIKEDTPFEFDDECHNAFKLLKEKRTCALVIVSPNWNLPFELMCDARDFVVGAILGKKDGKNFHPIYFASKTLNAAQQNYTITEKELMAVVFALTNFDPINYSVMPKALISDRGTHFCNKIMEKTMKRYGVNLRFSTSYNPQTSGQVENTNRALKRILEKTVKDNPAIWSRKLDDALWAFRTAFKTPTGTTPYKLVYGKNCHLPFKIEHSAYRALKNCNPDLIAAGEKRMFQLHELDEFRHQAYEHSRLYKARSKVWHDRKLKMRKEFKHGNKVLLFHSKYKFKQPKLRSRWLGPYVLKHQYPSVYVELYGKDGKTFIVNDH